MTESVDQKLSDLIEVTRTLRLFLRPEYRHKPLGPDQSIRLLILQPASSPGAPLVCDLQEVLLSEKPKYEALSYAWGDPVFSKQLLLPNGSLNVTKSLYLALACFRLEDKVRAIWADAVCINQIDHEEKGKQVVLMGEIYRRSQRVLVWLGPGDQYTGNVINILKQLAAESDRYGVQRGPDGFIVGDWAGAEAATGSVKEALENVAIDFDWSGADEIFGLPWFSRMWIVQEIALAPSAHLYCGSFEISWDDLMVATHVEYRSVQRATAMNLRLPFKFYQIQLLDAGIRTSKNSKANLRLLSLLMNFRFADCQDPRDRLYAMLSLKGTHDVGIIPSYDEPVTSIYRKFAVDILRQNLGNSKNIFYYAGVARRFRRKGKRLLEYKNTVHDRDSIPPLHAVCEELPSWVPDWRITGDYDSFYVNRKPLSLYSAATKFRPNFEVDSDDGSLRVVARMIDSIKCGKGLGSESEMNYNTHREQVLLMKDMYDREAERLKSGWLKLSNDEERLKVFARVIIADLMSSSTSTFLRDPLTIEDLPELWLQFASTPYKDESATEHFETDGSEGREAGTKMQQSVLQGTTKVKAYSRLFCYRTALKSLLDDRQFIITDAGFVGLAPALAQTGDMITVFAGLATPLVLRPTVPDEKGRTRYHIIGDCFLHGVMYGELNEHLTGGAWNWLTLS